MAADSATAEKIDLTLVSRKASAETAAGMNKPTAPEPYNKANTTPSADVKARIEKLQETINQIRSTTKAMGHTAEQINNISNTSSPTSYVKPANSFAQTTGTTPPAGATIRPKTVQSSTPAAMPANAQNYSQAYLDAQKNAQNKAAPRNPMLRPKMKPQAQKQASRPQVQQPRPAMNMSVPVPMSDVQRWKQYRMPKLNVPAWQKYLPDIGITATAAWLTGATLYLGGIVGWNNVLVMPAHHLGSVMAGVAAPLALMWMGIQYARRDRDIKEQMAPLLHQIDQLVNPNKDVEKRIDAVADGLRRQANELINAANQVEKTLGNVRDGLRTDMEKMLEMAGLTGKHLEQASVAMSSRTSHLARMTEQMHGRLMTFEEHAKGGSERIDQSVTEMMTKAQGATDKLERQANNIVAALHAANMRMSRTTDDLDSRIGQISNLADDTAAKFGNVAAEFGRQGLAVDKATDQMETQLLRMHDMLTRQLGEMTQAVGAFGNIGYDLAGAVTNFRSGAEQVVGAAIQQIQSYTQQMDARLADASASLDRTAGIAVSRVGALDSNIAEQLSEMQNNLRAAAQDTPRLIQAVLDDSTRRLCEMDVRFNGSGNQLTEQLSTLERTIGTRLDAMSNLANRMSEGATDQMRTIMTAIFADLETLKSQFGEQAGNTQRDLKLFHNDLAQTIESLAHVARRSTDRTVERILMLNAGISQRIIDLRETAEQAQTQGKTLEGTMSQHIGMMREANDQLTQQTTRLAMVGGHMASDLRDAAGQAMAQAEVLGHIISREADALRSVTSMSAQNIDEMTSAVEVSRSELYVTVAQSAEQINAIISDLNYQRNALDRTNDDSANTHAALYTEIMRLRDATQTLNRQVSETILSADDRAEGLRALTYRLDEVSQRIAMGMEVGQQTMREATHEMSLASTEARDMMLRSGQEMAEASTAVVRQLYDAAGKVIAQAEVLSQVIGREADLLQNATQVSSDKLDGAAATIEQSRATLYATVNGLAQQIGQMTRELDEQRRAFEGTSHYSAESHAALQEQMTKLYEVTSAMNDQVNGTVLSTDVRAEDLRQLTQELGQVTVSLKSVMVAGYDALENCTYKMQSVADHTRDVMFTSGQEIVRASAMMADDLRDASNQAMAQAEVLSHVIGRETEALRQMTEVSTDSLDLATAAIEVSRGELYGTIGATAEKINQAVRDMDSQRIRLEQTQGMTVNTYAVLNQEAEILCQVIASLNGQMETVTIANDDRAQELRLLITRLGEVSMGLPAVMQSGYDALLHGADHIESTSDNTRNMMLQSGQQLAEISAQIAMETAKISASLDMQQQTLERHVTTGADAMETMVQKIQTAADTVGLTSDAAARDIDWLCSHIESAGKKVDQMGVRTAIVLEDARSALTMSEANLQRSATSARSNLSEMAQRYSDEGGRISDQAEQMQRYYNDAITRLERLGNELAGQSFQTFDSLTEMGSLFDTRIAQLRDGSAGATEQLQRVANELQANYQSLTSATEEAARQLAQVQNGLSSSQADVTLTTDHANQQIDSVRKKLGIYAQDMMMMVAQASGQIESAAAGFHDKAAAIRQAANENVGAMGDMGQQVLAQIEQLVQTVSLATSQQSDGLSAAVEKLRLQAQELTRQTQQSMLDLERHGVRAIESAQQFNKTAEEAGQKLSQSSQQLQRQSEGVALTSTESAKRISQATQQMQMQSQTMKNIAATAAAVMGNSGEELTGKMNQFQAVSQRMQAQIGQLIDGVNQQMHALNTTSIKAEESAKQISQADTRSKRDAFLNAAKFVIESLNSLSIDLTRVLDPQEADRVWKEFAKGDASAFTRRFLQMREEVPMQRLKEKYEQDGQFRNYVMRYFRQFEELFEQALGNDHNDLLATTLTTSDVGKLYSYLAGALGHSKLKSVGNKAA
jgi:hypothetical protein